MFGEPLHLDSIAILNLPSFRAQPALSALSESSPGSFQGELQSGSIRPAEATCRAWGRAFQRWAAGNALPRAGSLVSRVATSVSKRGEGLVVASAGHALWGVGKRSLI